MSTPSDPHLIPGRIEENPAVARPAGAGESTSRSALPSARRAGMGKCALRPMPFGKCAQSRGASESATRDLSQTSASHAARNRQRSAALQSPAGQAGCFCTKGFGVRRLDAAVGAAGAVPHAGKIRFAGSTIQSQRSTPPLSRRLSRRGAAGGGSAPCLPGGTSLAAQGSARDRATATKEAH